MKKGRTYRTPNGYTWDSEALFTWEMHYDLKGVYLGQTQSDMEGWGDIYFSAEIIDGNPCVDGFPIPRLSQERMEKADEDYQEKIKV